MSCQEPNPFHIELDLDAYPAPPRTPTKEMLPPSLGERLRALPETSQILSAASRFASDPEAAITIYNADPETMGGRLIGGDDLVRVMPWRKDNPLLTYRFAGDAVAALPLRMFRKRMALPMTSPDEYVLITMGMPACGKTTLVKGGMGQFFHTIVDSPLASLDTARELRQIARESGRKVAFVYAHRHLALAVRGMLERALPWREGRTVSIEHMGNILVKGLALFRELADTNSADEETTLDMVEVIDGRRHWRCGQEALMRINEIRSELLNSGTSILGQLVQYWIEALQEAQAAGWNVPELLMALVQEDLDPRMLAAVQSSPSVIEGAEIQQALVLPSKIKSLADTPENRAHLLEWIKKADAYEAKLKTWNASNNLATLLNSNNMER